MGGAVGRTLDLPARSPFGEGRAAPSLVDILGLEWQERSRVGPYVKRSETGCARSANQLAGPDEINRKQ